MGDLGWFCCLRHKENSIGFGYLGDLCTESMDSLRCLIQAVIGVAIVGAVLLLGDCEGSPTMPTVVNEVSGGDPARLALFFRNLLPKSPVTLTFSPCESHPSNSVVVQPWERVVVEGIGTCRQSNTVWESRMFHVTENEILLTSGRLSCLWTSDLVSVTCFIFQDCKTFDALRRCPGGWSYQPFSRDENNPMSISITPESVEMGHFVDHNTSLEDE